MNFNNDIPWKGTGQINMNSQLGNEIFKISNRQDE